MLPTAALMPVRRHVTLAATVVSVALLGATPLAAQIPQAEFNARRDSLAAKLGDGMLVAFGGRTPVSDFGPFFQLPDFRYLTNYNEPDAAVVMVVRGEDSFQLFGGGTMLG